MRAFIIIFGIFLIVAGGLLANTQIIESTRVAQVYVAPTEAPSTPAPEIAETVVLEPTETAVPSIESTDEATGEGTGTVDLGGAPITITPHSLQLYLPQAIPTLGTHIVQSSETFYCLGRTYGVQPRMIAIINGFSMADTLPAGELLIIPDAPWETIPEGNTCFAQFQLGEQGETTDQNNDSNESTGFAGSQESDTTKQTPENATPVASLPTPTPFVELRHIEVNVPQIMALGESLQVALTFRPDAPAGENVSTIITGTPIPTPDTNFATFSQISQVTHLEDHLLFATARLDSAGFNISPNTDVRQMVLPGEEIEWHWSIKPVEAEKQTLIISLRLDYEPQIDDVPPLKTQTFWSDDFIVDVRATLLKLNVQQQSTIAFLGVGLGVVLTGSQIVTILFPRKERQ